MQMTEMNRRQNCHSMYCQSAILSSCGNNDLYDTNSDRRTAQLASAIRPVLYMYKQSDGTAVMSLAGL